MVKHIVLWNFVESLDETGRVEAGQKMKELLEGLKDKVPGVVELKVVVNEISSSNRDIALVSSFENEEALKGYQTHPEHVAAGQYVRSVTCERACMDYEV